MSAPVFDFKIQFRPGFQADMDARFAKVQYAFSQKVAATIDPYVPFDTGTLKNSVNQASDYKDGKLVYNTPYARAQYYLHPMGQSNELRGGKTPTGIAVTNTGYIVTSSEGSCRMQMQLRLTYYMPK